MKNKILILAFILFLVSNSNGQATDGWFNFSLPDLDTVMPAFSPQFDPVPVADDAFVSIDSEGHFTVNGKRIRFWGTPCFPFKEDYILPRERVHLLAKEYSRMGVNIVRLHLMDSKPFLGNNSIFGNNSGTRIPDAEQMDKIDYMIAEFKKQGIYIMLDLLCDRKYEEPDGVPDPDSVYIGAKEVNYFDPVLISLQKEYAQQLLTHINPYTGRALKDEPALALIDIVNEGWFLHSVRCDQMKPISAGGNLSQYHYNMLTGKWNAFLTEKYMTEDSLMKSWGLWPYIPIFLPNTGFESGFDGWEYGSYGSVVASIDISDDVYHSGDHAFHLHTTTSSPLSYECYLNRVFTAEPGKIHTISFWAKTGNLDNIDVQINQENQWIAGKSFVLSGDWKKYSFSFITNNNLNDEMKLFMNLGNVQGDLWIDDVEIALGEEQLHDGGSLAGQNIRLLNIWENESEIIRLRKMDQSEFYIKIQTDHYTDMRNFLKNDLGIRIPVTGSNYLVGIPDIYAQNSTDFVDNHGYWVYGEQTPASQIVHPSFNNAVLTLFAGLRIKGKPLTASEYNYEMVNPCANEALFFLTAYGSLQEADMLMIHGYDYGLMNNGILINNLDNYHRVFDKAMLPTFAYVYRNGLISGAQQKIDISFTKDDVNNLIFRDDQMWGTDAWPNDYPFKLAYRNCLRSNFESGVPYNAANYPAEPENPYTSDTQQIEWDSTGLLSVNTPRFCAAVGKLGAFAGKGIGPLHLDGADKSGGITLLSLDENAIENSKKLLMTISTQQLNDEMAVNGYEEIDFGHAPLMLEAISLSFTLQSAWDGITVYWLDEHGNPSGHHEAFTKNQENVIPVTINTYQNTGLWFGIEPLEPEPSIKLVNYHPDDSPVTGEPFVIRWNSPLVDSVDLYWSDGFTTQVIGTFDASAGSAAWTVPVSYSGTCNIAAISSSNPLIADTISFQIKSYIDNGLIKNGAFNAGMNYWTFYPDNSPSDVTYSTADQNLRVNIIKRPEQIWYYNLSQSDIFPGQGEYVLDFNLSIPVETFTPFSCHFANQNNWEFIGNANEFYLYRWEKEKHFQFPFTCPLEENVPVLFNLSLGGVDSVVVVDNIRLRKVNRLKPVHVTFRVDMKHEQVSAAGVNLNGNFLRWMPGSVLAMDSSGPVYSATISLPVGAEIEYKFINGSGDEWNKYEQLSGTCAWGTDKNRRLVVPETDTVLKLVCFAECDACSGSAVGKEPFETISIFPNPVNQKLAITGLPAGTCVIRIFDAMSKPVYMQETSEETCELNLSGLPSGIYFIRLSNEASVAVFKVVKQ